MLSAMLRKAVVANPAKTAIVQGRRRIAYGELDALARQGAAGLRRFGVGAGDCVAVVLTGMHCDGTAGLKPLKRAGAYAIAQDEATSVVWGMPGSAVRAGLADEVLPLGEIAAAIQALVQGRGGS